MVFLAGTAIDAPQNQSPEEVLRGFTERLSGFVIAGIIFGAAYLLVLFSGDRILPFSSPVTTAQLVKLAPSAAAVDNPCRFDRLAGAEPANGVRAMPSDTFLHVEVLPPPSAYRTSQVMFAGTILDRALMTVCDSEGRIITSLLSGDSVHYRERQLTVPEVAFQLPVLNEGDRLILGVTQETIVTVAMRVMESEAFLLYSAEKINIRIFLLGGLISIILYNIVLGALVLQWTYFFNALNSASMVILDLCLTGLGSTFIWSASPELSRPMLVVALAGPCMFGVLFVFHYLYPGDWRRLHRMPVFSIWLYISVVLSIYAFIAQNGIGELALIFGWLFSAAIIMTKLVQLSLQNNERAQILLIPFLAVILPSLCAGLARVYFGWNIGRLGDHHTEITYLLEALMFTLSLAYLLRIAEREREAERSAKLTIVEQSKQQLLGMVDSERTRISSDLHDTAGQGLVTVAGRLNRIAKSPKLDAGQRAQLKDVEQTMKTLLDDIRRISHDLHPAALDHIGLSGAIRELARHASRAGKAKVSVEIDMDGGFTRADELQFYRIVQELLSNAVRHSGATRIDIAITEAKGEVRLRVSDNGGGVKPASRPGIGMQVVGQRVDMLDGIISIRSGSEGTLVEVRVPVREAGREEPTDMPAGTERGIQGA